MALTNDHYYGYVRKFLVENNVTWLECAASSIFWTTLMIYYLEDPFGHLMGEKMGQAQSRAQVRGNLFSFSMPWEEIARCCTEVLRSSGQESQEAIAKLQAEMGLPHSEETLATLVHVQIRCGSKDLAMHLRGLTMRADIVRG